MVRSITRRVGILAASILVACPAAAHAQQKEAYDLLSPETQAVVWVRDGNELLERWHRTQLSKLTEDEAIAPFFREKRQEIEKRLMDAGWRLNIRPEDLSEHLTGQVAVAWTVEAATPIKPYTVALIADVENDEQINARMMQQFEGQFDPAKAKKQTFAYDGTTVTRYSLPPRPGEYIEQLSYLAIVPGAAGEQSLLLASDDKTLIQDLIDRAKGKSTAAKLSEDSVFVKGRALAGVSGQGQVEYFIRPLGFAKVIRAIAGKRSKSNTDILAALENQGFGAIECVCGELLLGGAQLDLQHRGYLYSQKPFTKSARLLDFPNEASHVIPNFVGAGISSLLVTSWNAKEAFWAAEGLVDDIAGTPGVFEEVINGIKNDPNGPRIDIRQVLPIFTNDIYSISDNREGEAAVDSRRNLIALKLNDAAEMTRVLNQAMKGEPDAEPVDFNGHRIWKVVRPDEVPLPDDDFGDFAPPPEQAADENDQPWLSNWAITVHGDFLMFASHVEMIQDAIEQANLNEVSPLVTTPDYERVIAAISEIYGDEPGSAWKILRSDKAFRIQYELFRKGELRRSESMLASILDRLVQADDEMEAKEQKISGEGLPEFSAITKYLQPSGLKVRSTDEGWEFGSLILAPHYQPGAAPAVTRSSAQVGTARAGEGGANR